MGFILFLLLLGAIIMGILYLVQFYGEMEGDKEKVIKDGLITELLKDPQSKLENSKITVGRIEIEENRFGGIWFPYEVNRRGLTYGERYHSNEDPYSCCIGYIMFLSKDYFTVRKIFKNIKSKQNIEQNQKQKLGLK